MTREERQYVAEVQFELAALGVRRQRRRIQELEASGQSTVLAKELLKAFEHGLRQRRAQLESGAARHLMNDPTSKAFVGQEVL